MSLGTYRVCSVDEIFEYTFDDVRVDSRCWLEMYLGNGFYTLYFKFIFVVNGASNINISKKCNDFFSFSYSMVSWIAGSCLFKIS